MGEFTEEQKYENAKLRWVDARGEPIESLAALMEIGYKEVKRVKGWPSHADILVTREQYDEINRLIFEYNVEAGMIDYGHCRVFAEDGRNRVAREEYAALTESLS